LNIGLDGLLYALDAGRVQVFDPISMVHLRTTHVSGSSLRAVAADTDGSLFVLSFLSELYHFDPNGQLLNSIQLPTNNTIDVDIRDDGTIAVGERFGLLAFTDRYFATVRTLSVASQNTFVAFVPVPEPSAVVVVLSLALILAGGNVTRSESSRF
jgi:hypothetical protein